MKEVKTGEGVTRTLARFSAGLQFEDLPAAVVQEVKRLLLDTIGCGLGGLAVDKGRMAVALARQMGGVSESTVLGSREKVPAALAAFANGELMNALDWNALLPPSHVPPYVIPAALALAEGHHKSGRDLIVSLALAFEIAGRVGASLGGLRATPGGFPLAVWGISSNQFGATIGAARILGLDADRMQHALGLAGYYAPVPSHAKYNHTTHVGYAKYAPSGWMAQGGVVTAQLAAMDYHGDLTVLEGPNGFWAMNGAPSCDWASMTRGLGEQWLFTNAAYKYWPTCGMFQSPLDVFVALIDEHGLSADEIDDVLVEIEAFGALPKYTNSEPTDHVEAASSLPYCIAVAAHRIRRGPGWQAASVLADPGIRRFMKKVRHGVNPRSEELRQLDLVVEGRPYLSHRPANVEIRARGQVFPKSVDFANWLSIGVPACRPSDEGLAEKFRANAEATIDPATIEKAIAAFQELETLPDISPLMDLLSR